MKIFTSFAFIIYLAISLQVIASIKLINNDINLYKPDKKSYLESLNYAKNMIPVFDEKLVFHCFWRVPRDFSLKQVTVLKSIIVQHEQHLDKLEINLWSNVDLSQNEWFQQVSDFVNLKKWNYEEEIKGTVLENAAHLSIDSIYDSLCWLEGDVFRLLILNKYGGFYIDMDALVLRDLSPFNHLEFLYQLGTSGFTDDFPNIKMNGAVMRLEKGSPLSYELLEKLLSQPVAKNTFAFGADLYSKIDRNDILVLPGIWIDSESGFEGCHLEPFKKMDKMDLYDGAFTWHWHNRWDQPIEEGSKFDYLEKQIDMKFQEIKSRTNRVVKNEIS